MYSDGRDRIGSALRQMAEDLVRERRRVLELSRENRRLRAELERLQGRPVDGAGASVTRRRASSTTGDAR